MPIALQSTSIQGTDGSYVDILYRPPLTSEDANLLVFFPGDISDFAFSRISDPLVVGTRFDSEYEFSLDSISWNLCSRIPEITGLLIIRPYKMIGWLSLYTNFFASDSCGDAIWDIDPDKKPEMKASKSLLQYLTSLKNRVDQNAPIDKLILVGFSKGCQVISAFLKERDPSVLRRVQSFIYIDPGSHSPAKLFPFLDADYAVFPTSIPITLVCSPYQYDDPERKWLRTEINEFVLKSECRFKYISQLEKSVSGHFNTIVLAWTYV